MTELKVFLRKVVARHDAARLASRKSGSYPDRQLAFLLS
jgi:hypothetical protein